MRSLSTNLRSFASKPNRLPLGFRTIHSSNLRSFVSVPLAAPLHRTPRAATTETIANEVQLQVDSGAEDPFYIIDLLAARDKVALWRALLPEVKPFYAVKCNPDVQLLSVLAEEGLGFDCASEAEIKLLLDLDVDPSRILYANPCKQPSQLRRAAEWNCNFTVFDGEEELVKTARLHPGAGLLLRIQVDDSRSACVLSDKYGAPIDQVPFLLQRARELNLNVRGVSFHVGSGGSGSDTPDAFVDAVARADHVFDLAREAGMSMDVLDIGGGFPGVDTEQLAFADIAAALRVALRRHFPASRGVEVIAEPGRYIAATSHTLAANIIGKKTEHATEDTPARTMYYINDGLYGSFNCVLYDHAEPDFKVLDPGSDASPLQPCSIWGPTCDGLDCVSREAMLPDLEVGEWLYFPNMGAYTAAAGSNFNGMPTPDKYYMASSSSTPPPSAAVHAASEDMEMPRDEQVAACG